MRESRLNYFLQKLGMVTQFRSKERRTKFEASLGLKPNSGSLHFVAGVITECMDLTRLD